MDFYLNDFFKHDFFKADTFKDSPKGVNHKPKPKKKRNASKNKR